MELGTVYHELGSKVSVVEMTPGLLMGADRDLADILYKRVVTKFAKIMLETKVVKMGTSSKGVTVTFSDKEGKEFKEEYNKILVSVGRKPNSENLGLENTKVKVTPRGFVEINDQRQTADPVASFGHRRHCQGTPCSRTKLPTKDVWRWKRLPEKRWLLNRRPSLPLSLPIPKSPGAD